MNCGPSIHVGGPLHLRCLDGDLSLGEALLVRLRNFPVFGHAIKPGTSGNFGQILIVRRPVHFMLGWLQFLSDGFHGEFLLCGWCCFLDGDLRL